MFFQGLASENESKMVGFSEEFEMLYYFSYTVNFGVLPEHHEWGRKNGTFCVPLLHITCMDNMIEDVKQHLSVSKASSCSWFHFHSGIVVFFFIVVLDLAVECVRFVRGRAIFELYLMNFLKYSYKSQEFPYFLRFVGCTA